MPEKTGGFWSSLPGMLTGIAAVVTACTGLYLAMKDDTPSSAQDGHQPGIELAHLESEKLSNKPETDPSNPVASLAEKSLPRRLQSTRPEPPVAEMTPFPESGPLVDCALFPSVNRVDSLMSWSDFYHKQILAADGVKRRARDPYNKAIDYRGMAHCRVPTDPQIRLSLLETLTLCRVAGIEWTEIEHTKIIGDPGR